MNKITILILTWKNINLLKECINSLEKQSFNLFDLVVVANGSYQPTIEFLQKKKIRYFRFLKNQGVTKAFNYAAKKIQTKYIMFLNDDTELDIDCVKHLFLFMEHQPNVSACDSLILYRGLKNIVWSAGGKYSFFGKSNFRLQGKNIKFVSKKPKKTFCAIGSCAFYRKNDIKNLDFFNDIYFLSHEDLDLSFKILSQKKKIYNIPKSKVYHSVSATTKRLSNSYVYRSQRSVEIVYLLNFNLILLFITLPLHLIYIFLGLIYFRDKNFKSFIKAKRDVFFEIPNIMKYRKLYQTKNKLNFIQQIKNIITLR